MIPGLILAADLFEKQFGSLMPPADAEAAEDLLIGLNPEQREAVLHTEGPLLVLPEPVPAKPGVTHRIARLRCRLRRAAPAYSGDYLYEQGGARNARAHRESNRRSGGRHVGRFFH